MNGDADGGKDSGIGINASGNGGGLVTINTQAGSAVTGTAGVNALSSGAVGAGKDAISLDLDGSTTATTGVGVNANAGVASAGNIKITGSGEIIAETGGII